MVLPRCWASTPARLSLEQYRAALLKARALAVTLPGEENSPALAGRLTAALPLQAQVRLSSGTIVAVDNRPLARLLAGPSAGGERAVRAGGRQPSRHRPRRWRGRWRFVAALDQILAATPVSAPAIDRAAADEMLHRVLARPEYQYQPKKPSLIERFFNWLGDLISRFFLWLARLLDRWLPAWGPTPGRADRLAQFMVIGVVLLLAGLIARMLLVILPNLRRSARLKPPETAGGELRLPLEPLALLAEAEREAAAGRYREALRLAYLATVARLDRAGVLPEDRSRTHWELLRDLRRASDPSSSLIALLAPLTQCLDERLYGGRTATADDYQACRAAHDQIERLLCAPA